MDTGKALKLALLNSGKTQRVVASDLKMSPIVLNRQFNQKSISNSTLVKFADYFGLKPSELIALSE